VESSPLKANLPPMPHHKNEDKKTTGPMWSICGNLIHVLVPFYLWVSRMYNVICQRVQNLYKINRALVMTMGCQCLCLYWFLVLNVISCWTHLSTYYFSRSIPMLSSQYRFFLCTVLVSSGCMQVGIYALLPLRYLLAHLEIYHLNFVHSLKKNDLVYTKQSLVQSMF
jgi:hypothetical protein